VSLGPSCDADEPTLIVVEVFTEDLAPDVDLDTIRLRALRPGVEQPALDLKYRVGDGHQSLPLRVALYPKGRHDASIEVVAEATLVPPGQDPDNECVMACSGNPYCQGSGTLGAPCHPTTQPCLGTGLECPDVGGVCQCARYQSDCNGTPEDGCVINTSSDMDNCGSCGSVCAPTAVCCKGSMCSSNSNYCD
jgi:hypothetical protein